MSIRDTIEQVAREEGIDPAYALAVAERESSLNPNAGGTGSIRGLYQMTGKNRMKYGLPDGADAAEQTRAFARFTRDLRADMATHLGRDPTNSETYLGHYWGGSRAARVIAGQHAGMSPSDVFSPRELAGNPDLRKHATVGDAAANITADMDRRQAKFGGQGGSEGTDFASFGQPLENAPNNKSGEVAQNLNTAGPAIDFAAFGQPIEPTSTKTVDFAQFGQPPAATPAAQGGAVGFGSLDPAGGAGPAAQDQDVIRDAARWERFPASDNVEDRRSERYKPSDTEFYDAEKESDRLKQQRLAQPIALTGLGAQAGLDDIPSAQHPEGPPLYSPIQ